MSDTVMIALITFLAGLSGSVVGAIATLQISIFKRKIRTKQTDLQ